jgi:hypothetical protein
VIGSHTIRIDERQGKCRGKSENLNGIGTLLKEYRNVIGIGRTLEEEKECWENRNNRGRIKRMSEEYKVCRKNIKYVGRIQRMSEEYKECRKNKKNVGRIRRISEE